MKKALCVVVLLLASGAWGQQVRQLTVSDGNNEICGLDAKGQPFLGSGYTWRQCAVLLMSIALPPAKQEKKAPPKGSAWLNALKEDSAAISCNDAYDAPPCPNDAIKNWVTSRAAVAPPFDVPPKEMDAWEPPLENNWQALLASGGRILPCSMPPTGTASTASYICLNGIVHYYKSGVRTCTDKRRVLLMSEDGKWHCFAFVALAGAR